MRVLWVVVATLVVVAVAVPVYWVLSRPSTASPCGSSSGGSPPLVQPVGAPPFALGASTSSTVHGEFWDNLSVEDSPPSTVADELHLRVASLNNTTVSGVREFLLWNVSAVLVAAANGTTSQWIEGGSTSVAGGDTLTVVSIASLLGDVLHATVPIGCGENATVAASLS